VATPAMHIGMQFRSIDGLQIRYAMSGPREEQALLLSPWPESLLAFEQMWDPLSERAQLIAVDLPGYGHSEARDDLYPPHKMGEFAIRLLDEFELERPHAVGPDIGVATLLFAASSNPDRFRSLVVGSGSASVPLQLGVELKQFVEAPDVEFLRGANPRDLVNTVLNHLERFEPPDATREDYVTGYLGDRFIDSLKFVRALLWGRRWVERRLREGVTSLAVRLEGRMSSDVIVGYHGKHVAPGPAPALPRSAVTTTRSGARAPTRSLRCSRRSPWACSRSG